MVGYLIAGLVLAVVTVLVARRRARRRTQIQLVTHQLRQLDMDALEILRSRAKKRRADNARRRIPSRVQPDA